MGGIGGTWNNDLCSKVVCVKQIVQTFAKVVARSQYLSPTLSSRVLQLFAKHRDRRGPRLAQVASVLLVGRSGMTLSHNAWFVSDTAFLALTVSGERICHSTLHNRTLTINRFLCKNRSQVQRVVLSTTCPIARPRSPRPTQRSQHSTPCATATASPTAQVPVLVSPSRSTNRVLVPTNASEFMKRHQLATMATAKSN